MKKKGIRYAVITVIIVGIVIFFLNFSFSATESGIQEEWDKYNINKNVRENKSGIGLGVLINFVIALIVVIGVIYIVKFFIFQKTVSLEIGEEFINILAQKSIGPNKLIQIIEVANKVLIIGITEKEISMLGEIEDEEIINVIKFQASQNSGKRMPSFRNYFESVLSKWHLLREGEEKTGKDFIKSLKDRLSKYKEDDKNKKE